MAQEQVRHWLRVIEGSWSGAPGTESSVTTEATYIPPTPVVHEGKWLQLLRDVAVRNPWKKSVMRLQRVHWDQPDPLSSGPLQAVDKPGQGHGTEEQGISLGLVLCFAYETLFALLAAINISSLVSECQAAALPGGLLCAGAPWQLGDLHGAAGQGLAARTCPTTPARSGVVWGSKPSLLFLQFAPYLSHLYLFQS